jgi:hypothetical protein
VRFELENGHKGSSLSLQVWNTNLLCTEQLGLVDLDLWHINCQELAGLPNWFDLSTEGRVQCTVSFELREDEKQVSAFGG